MALRNYMYSKHKQNDAISNLIFQGKEQTNNNDVKLEHHNNNSSKNSLVETHESCDEHRSPTLVNNEETEVFKRVSNKNPKISIEQNDNDDISKINDKNDSNENNNNINNINNNNINDKGLMNEERSDSIATLGSIENTEQLEQHQD
ncbi:hypothetical protein HANVADRAFT_96826 [Hanseniaspora valbyensis NRRL Y-1626]|uniref:Uncharacterized protein n=1 Tax=Hanseniaspora valbyensis NRRL Y-1626 TaxID=766949 RepID=A0A1B7T7V3_9ASCO|nr:hypothetical protein HANVADRAFT_96826 [Hanseniaspora valbyensis NRRL Y-1626]